MRTYRASFAVGAVALGLVILGGPAPLLAGIVSRHSGIVRAVNLQADTLTLEELAALGRLRTLHIRIPPGVRPIRSERLPDSQVTDLRHPFKESSIDLAHVRPGDFVVVEVSGTGTKEEARSVVVTFEPQAHAGRSTHAVAQRKEA